MRCSKLRYYSDLELASSSEKSTKTSFSRCPFSLYYRLVFRKKKQFNGKNFTISFKITKNSVKAAEFCLKIPQLKKSPKV